MGKLLTIIILAFIVAAGIAMAQSTAGQGYPVVLSTTTTGTYACPAGAVLPCTLPIDASHPLPTQAQ